MIAIDILEVLVVFYLISLTIGFLLSPGGWSAKYDKAMRKDEEVPK